MSRRPTARRNHRFMSPPTLPALRQPHPSLSLQARLLLSWNGTRVGPTAAVERALRSCALREQGISTGVIPPPFSPATLPTTMPIASLHLARVRT